MKKVDPILSRCPLFEGLDMTELDAILACLGARTVEVSKGQAVFREGDPATDVGIVLEGSLQLIREDYYGNRSIVAHIPPAAVFGETYACAQAATMPVSAVALEDSRCMLIDCRRITVSCTSACAFHSRVILNLLRLMAEKNLVYDQKIAVTSQRTTREKLMTYLLQEAKLRGSSTFTIPYNRQGLADYLEVDRSGLSVEIGKLRREGKLLCDKNNFTLL